MSRRRSQPARRADADKGVLLIMALVCVPIAICATWVVLLA